MDIKWVAILVLLVTNILFFGIWFFKGSDTKDKIKLLEEKNISIERQRDSLDRVNSGLRLEFNKIQKSIDERDSKIKDIEDQLSKVKKELDIANAKVNKYKKDLDETKRNIENLKRNPIKREGDDLINSLKEKLK